MPTTHIGNGHAAQAPILPPPTARAVLRPAKDRQPRPLNELLYEGAFLTVTPELAHRILDDLQYDGHQRLIRTERVQVWAGKLRHGEFRPGDQINFGRLPDGTLKLVNGQHRLTAITNCEIATTFRVNVIDVENELGLGTLYRSFDRDGLMRSTVDSLSAELGEYQLQKQIATGTFNAVKLIMLNFRTGRKGEGKHLKLDPYELLSDDARLRAAAPWWPLARQYQDCVTDAARGLHSYLRSAAVIAVALATLRYQNELADEFWEKVAQGGDYRDPCGIYARYLLMNRRPNPHDAVRAAASAWNAFYENREVTFLRAHDHPVKIMGTPWGNPKNPPLTTNA